MMRVGTLPPAIAALRAARAANDNAPAGAGPDDRAPGRPLVRALRRRPNTTYASAGNVILPLQFAQRMPSWQRA